MKTEEQKKKHTEYMRIWRNLNPEKVKEIKLRRRTYSQDKEDRPWINSFSKAKRRCLNEKDPSYKRYGGRGIKFLMNNNDLEFLWKRDRANQMSWPSLDRIDNDGNYEITNCRFIEMGLNSSLGKRGINNHFCKLTEENVREIIKLKKSGMIVRKISNKFNISYSHTVDIINGKKWSHLTNIKQVD